MTVLTSVAVQITAAGPSRPAYADILETLNAQFQTIYGLDAYIDPDSQDGQWIAVIAKAIDDCNGQAVAVYNSFSPATAQADALSNNVKINGMKRAVPTNSTALERITGTVGTVITNGVVTDAAGNKWDLPATVTIPSAGYVDVTVTCEVKGAVQANTGTITGIQTPTLGWASATNTAPAQPGAPVETDAALRQRQAVTVALPSQSVLDGVIAAVAACAGVTQVKGYNNPTGTADANGVPAHSMCIVALGGIAADIGQAIIAKKAPGCGTYGTTSVTGTSPKGVPETVNYDQAQQVPLGMVITIKALTGYTSAVGTEIVNAAVAYVNALGIGQKVYLGKLYLPVQLFGGADAATFDAVSITLGPQGGTMSAADYAIAFNQIATLAAADVTLTVT